MIDLRSGPAHVGKHDDRTATQTTEDLAGALTSEGLPQRREQLREPALFLHGESVAAKNTPTTTSPTVAGKRNFHGAALDLVTSAAAGRSRDDQAVHLGSLPATDPDRRDACIIG